MPTQAPTDSDLGFPAKGSLKRVPFAFLVRDISRARSTGNLYLLAGETKKVVFFVDGRPTLVRSNLASEFLGQILTDQGLITQEQCDNTLEAIRRTGKKQGELLVEMGILSEGNLRYGLEEQVRIKLFEIFGWEEGRFQFKQGGEPGAPTGMALEQPLEAVILAAVQERWNDERARTALKTLAERYPAVNARWTGEQTAELDLLPEELYFLRCLDGSRTVDELLARKYDPEVPQISTLLFCLVASGVVEAGETKLARRLPPPRPNLTPTNPPDDKLAPKFEQLSAITEYEDTPLPNKLPGGAAISSSRNPRVPVLPTEDEEMFRGLDVDESIVADSRALLRAVSERGIKSVARPAPEPTTRAPAAEPRPLDDETDFGDLGADDDDETDFSDLVHTTLPGGAAAKPQQPAQPVTRADSNKSVLPQPPLGRSDSSKSPLPQPKPDSSTSPLPQPKLDSSRASLPQPKLDSNKSPLPQPKPDSNKSPIPQPAAAMQPRPDSNKSPLPRPTLAAAPTPTLGEPRPMPEPARAPEPDPLADLEADDDLGDLGDLGDLDGDLEALDDDTMLGDDLGDDPLGDDPLGDDPLGDDPLAAGSTLDADDGDLLGDSALSDASGALAAIDLDASESGLMPGLDAGDDAGDDAGLDAGDDDGLNIGGAGGDDGDEASDASGASGEAADEASEDDEIDELDEDLEIEDVELEGGDDEFGDDDGGFRSSNEDTDGGFRVAGGVESAEVLGATRYSQAEDAMREGDFDQAVALFEDAYANGYDVAELHAHLAFARFRASGNDPSSGAGALELLDWAEQADPGLPMIHAYRGAILVGMGRQEEADECFERALYLDPENELALAYTRGE